MITCWKSKAFLTNVTRLSSSSVFEKRARKVEHYVRASHCNTARPFQICFLWACGMVSFYEYMTWMYIIVHYFFSLILALQEDFLRIPRSRCKPFGTTAIFHCRVQGFVTAYWRCTTGLVVCNFNYTSRHILNLNITRSRLEVPASTQYNGTRFHCCFTTGTEHHCSRPAAILFVACKICMPS